MSAPDIKYLLEQGAIQQRIVAAYHALGLTPPEFVAFTVTETTEDEDTGDELLTISSPCGQIEIEVNISEFERSLRTIN